MKTIYRSDYHPLTWQAAHIHLVFDLSPRATRVVATTQFERQGEGNTLVLNGEALTTISVKVDGRTLDDSQYKMDATTLSIDDLPDRFTLEITTEIDPIENLALSGLYMSSDYFCTQCEAEGFRRIVWAQDRPDSLSVYDVELRADAQDAPVLLSNGNPGETGQLEDGRHFARWHDPHPKPPYLFALVAGNLAHIEEQFITASGRKVRLRIYALDHYLEQCHYAMGALIRAMRWDEETYGREYDLDVFNIVATDDFNMGAMENKGLNIFNTKLVLASAATATDSDFYRVESVIGHEYFHNWSGNRVTCRDWFQLSLKEGFTVYRDQEFSADLNSRGVQRIDDVNLLRSVQFKEDAGPLAHSVRPDSYQSINNFYTATVYEKGAELVRMQANIVGREGFRKATDYYFTEFDGQAVTCDDFVDCIEVINKVDLSHFKRWYAQAGTPRVSITETLGGHTLDLIITQRTLPTPGQDQKQALYIPINTLLFDKDGSPIKITALDGAPHRLTQDGGAVIILEADEHHVRIEADSEIYVASYLREFSAPIILDVPRTPAELRFVVTHETDPFVIWEAAQRVMEDAIVERRADSTASLSTVIDLVGDVLANRAIDDALSARVLRLPEVGYISEHLDTPIDPLELVRAMQGVADEIAKKYADIWREKARVKSGLSSDAEAVGQRAIAALARYYVSLLDDGIDDVINAYAQADTMELKMSALTALARFANDERAKAIFSAFYLEFQHSPLIVDMWFSAQASVWHTDILDKIEALSNHPAFTANNPNRLRALIGAMIRNPFAFHREDGGGYKMLSDMIISVDAINPEMAAALAKGFSIYPKLTAVRREQISTQLTRILSLQDLSTNTREIIEKVVASCSD